jgi:small GTP-binding protein
MHPSLNNPHQLFQNIPYNPESDLKILHFLNPERYVFMAGPEELLKILVIGESAVGKSCLLLRYTDNKFQETFMTTIGVDFKTKYIEVDHVRVKLQIWDTAGQEKFRSITKAYYRGAHGILVVFDVSRRDTFNQTRMWVDSIRDSSTDSNPIDVILVGNKCDLERVVSTEEGEDLAKQFQIPYFETSAKDATNVDKAFTSLATAALKRRQAQGGKFAGGQKPQVTVESGGKQGGGDCQC